METELMDGLKSALGNETAPEADANTQDTPVDAPLNPEGTAQVETPKVEEAIDWTRDGRYKTMWKGDPNLMYKSIQESDKGYKLLQKDFSRYKKPFDELKLEPESITEIYNEYNQLKSPDHPSNKVSSYVMDWLQNDLYKDKVASFFQTLEQEELMRKYPNMNSEQIKKQMELEHKVQSLEKVQAEADMEKSRQQLTNQVLESVEKIKAYSNGKGFDFTDQMAIELMQDMAQQQLGPRDAFALFQEKYNQQLEDSYRSKLEGELMEKMKKSRGAVVGVANKQNEKSTSGGLKESLGRLLTKQLN